MDHDAFVQLVRQMRAAQCEYFKNRDREVLAESKRLERLVDAQIARVYQSELFSS